MRETERFKQMNRYLVLAMIMGGLALVSSFVKNIFTEKWAKNRNKVACIPADINSPLPLVYHQTSSHPVYNDSEIKAFVEEYIHATLDEQIVDYHKATNNKRYDNARLSRKKWKAIEMSCCAEKASNFKRYAESNEVFYTLQQGNMGWIFLIDDIMIIPGQRSGAVVAVVRGEFQVTYDRVKADLPPRLWGYREITLIINEGLPIEDTKDNIINKFGYYVAFSSMQTLTPKQKANRTQRNYDYYLRKENL